MEATITMLHDQGLPMHFLVEETRAVVYVQNHTPHRVLENKILEEYFLGEKVEVTHLRVFGFLVYVNIPNKKRIKLNPRGWKGIVVEYNETSKSYQI